MSVTPAATSGRPLVTFWGAARTVTGSMHQVDFAGRRLLLDCGLVRGPRTTARRPCLDFPFPAESVDAVVLSHAHTDHCGNLPNLVRCGFTGPIYCTAPTRDLTALMLADAARIHEEDARVAAVVGREAAPSGPSSPTCEDVRTAAARCATVGYDQPVEILPGVRLRFLDAGHLLGSALTELTFAAPGGDRTLVFTGDLGRRVLPLLAGPATLPASDLLICESTYGGRTHQSAEQVAETLRDLVGRTLARGGKVLVPAFSLGRTQVVVRSLQRALTEAGLGRTPIHVDSRMAAAIADVYRRWRPWLTEDVEAADGPPVHYLTDREESEELIDRREPCVVVASGGMCDGGRIMGYLKQHLDDPRCSLALVSFQAPHSLGRRLLDKGPTVRFHGRTWNKWIDVVRLEGFSAHADQGEILAELRSQPRHPARVRLVHGEPEAAAALAAAVGRELDSDVAAPNPGDVAAV